MESTVFGYCLHYCMLCATSLKIVYIYIYIYIYIYTDMHAFSKLLYFLFVQQVNFSSKFLSYIKLILTSMDASIIRWYSKLQA